MERWGHHPPMGGVSVNLIPPCLDPFPESSARRKDFSAPLLSKSKRREKHQKAPFYQTLPITAGHWADY